ncbi:MAG: 2-dehydropantoate 2-reductase [Pseudooceanicola sp.]
MIAILGAGAIGGYLGGCLAASGAAVTFVGRNGPPKGLDGGLRIVALDGGERRVAREAYALDGPGALREADLILLCTKSTDTDAAADMIASQRARAQVVSLQNGLGNVELIGQHIGSDRVDAGIVGFNVVRPEPGTFRQATDGEVIVASAQAELAAALRKAGLKAGTTDNIIGVQWSKLLLNLNNPLNALSGLPLRDHLKDRDWRRIAADCAEEAIAVARARGIRLERIGGRHPAIIPRVLRLPNPLFRVVAAAMMRIDPDARTSMAQDLAAGRTSELPWLNGKVAEAGRRTGVPTPVIDAVIAMTDAAFAAGKSPALTGKAARKRIDEIRSAG